MEKKKFQVTLVLALQLVTGCGVMGITEASVGGIRFVASFAWRLLLLPGTLSGSEAPFE